MIEIKTEELVKPLPRESNLYPVYYKIKAMINNVNRLTRDLKYNIYDGKKGLVNDFFAQYDKEYKIIKLANIDTELVKQYEDLRSGYLEFEKMVQSILNCVKIGESQETAIKKIVKMTKTIKYFSWEKLKYVGNYFDPMSEEAILKEIERFRGCLKLRGAMDLYVLFKDGKVESIYF